MPWEGFVAAVWHTSVWNQREGCFLDAAFGFQVVEALHDPGAADYVDGAQHISGL
jgi:hypothetical protein